MWLTKDKDGQTIKMHYTYPIKDKDYFFGEEMDIWKSNDEVILTEKTTYNNKFPFLTYENSPIEIDINTARRDMIINHDGRILDCKCIQRNENNTHVDGKEVCIVHNVGDICKCKEICNKENKAIGYFIKFGKAFKWIGDITPYYKIIEE